MVCKQQFEAEVPTSQSISTNYRSLINEIIASVYLLIIAQTLLYGGKTVAVVLRHLVYGF